MASIDRPCGDRHGGRQAMHAIDGRDGVEPRRPLVVLSHQRWDFPVRRTQHLMLRLARHYRIVFVEPAWQDASAPGIVVRSPLPGVEVLTPHTPLPDEPFADRQMPVLRALLAQWLRAQGIGACIAWASTPRVEPLMGTLDAALALYDCIDTAPPGDPLQWQQREAALLRRCQVVLAPGPAAVEAKRRLHPYVLCVPNAVDAQHFSPHAVDPRDPLACDAEQAHAAIARPRLGCFGMVDERVDFGLLTALADARRDWQIVMVGPVQSGGCDAPLPRRPNLHWLGPRPYALLPHLMAGWDLCLVPFVVSGATRLASPARTLEYMAAEKPVVSTAIDDIVSLYGDVVHVARDRAGFIAACAAALHETRPRRDRRIRDMLIEVSRASWDRTADAAHDVIEQQLRRAAVRAALGPMAPRLGWRPPLLDDAAAPAGATIRPHADPTGRPTAEPTAIKTSAMRA